MRRATTASHSPRAAWLGAAAQMARGIGRWAWQVALAMCLTWGLGVAHNARAQGVELATLELRPDEGALTLEFNARLTLSRAIEDALRRGVPMYFEVDATLYRSRWYWRDERVARVSRSYRLSFQPLTLPKPGNWKATCATTWSSAIGSTLRNCRSRCRSGWAPSGRWAFRAC